MQRVQEGANANNLVVVGLLQAASPECSAVQGRLQGSNANMATKFWLVVNSYYYVFQTSGPHPHVSCHLPTCTGLLGLSDCFFFKKPAQIADAAEMLLGHIRI